MFLRVTDLEKPAFQLRKREDGISVFDANAVEPALTEAEVLDAFRPRSIVVARTRDEIEAKGLKIVAILGAESLPMRLREAHMEIRSGAGWTRGQFKKALQELE